jgi:hypothetical protein
MKAMLKGFELRMPDGRKAGGELCEGVGRVMELLYAVIGKGPFEVAAL